MATPQQIAEARAQAGFHGPATRQDILNAQKYGLGIFAATAKKIQSQGQGGAQGPAPTSDLSQQIADQQSSLGQLQANVPGYLDSQQSQILAQNPEYASIQSQRAQATGQLFSQPFEAAQQYSNVFNPMDRDKLISQAVGNVLQRLTGFNDILGNQRADAKGLAQQSLDRLNSQISLGKSNLDALQGQQTRADKLAAEQTQQAYQQQTLAGTERQRKFSNALDIAKFNLELKKAAASKSAGKLEKPLTPTQVIALNNAGLDVKLGQKLSDVAGQQPGNTQPKSYTDFVKQYSTSNKINPADPSGLYNQYLTAQQNYNVSEDKAAYLDLIRKSHPDIAALLKIPNVSQNNLLAALSAIGADGQ